MQPSVVAVRARPRSSRHLRMDRAKIVDDAHLAEKVREGAVGIERIRSEGTVLLFHHMDDIVLIFPCHRRTDMHGQRGRSEGEIGDTNHVFGAGRIVACQHHIPEAAAILRATHALDDGVGDGRSLRHGGASSHMAGCRRRHAMPPSHQPARGSAPRRRQCRFLTSSSDFLGISGEWRFSWRACCRSPRGACRPCRTSTRRDAEHRAQLLRRHAHRSGRGRRTRRGLRESGRSRGVEGDVAFNFLHDLVNMTVQHRDRAEALQQARAPAALSSVPHPQLA